MSTVEPQYNRCVDLDSKFGTICHEDDTHPFFVANIGKLLTLDWKPKVSLQEGLRKIMECSYHL